MSTRLTLWVREMFRTHTVSSRHVEKERLYLDDVLYWAV
jgi:hypothetical protein